MSVENPGGMRWWRGGYVCECVTLIYPIMEERMVAAGVLEESFDVYQYGYNAGGVSASAGTHDEGGTTDHGEDGWTQLEIQRECGAELHGLALPLKASILTATRFCAAARISAAVQPIR
jgi:hypothetical protein